MKIHTSSVAGEDFRGKRGVGPKAKKTTCVLGEERLGVGTHISAA